MTGLILLLMLNLAPASAQDHFHVTLDSLAEFGVIILSEREGWYFQAGDDIRWADPGYDDSDWISLKPSLMATPIPDTLWEGYGWFRFRFTADSTIYDQAWYLYYFTWGAAEVYLDGRLVQSYGKFSTERKKEVRNNPFNKLAPGVALTPGESHLLAVRFSYHEAARYYSLLGHNMQYFGFGIGLATEEYNTFVASTLDRGTRTSYISSAMLLVILLLHGFLFYLFPGERSNLYIAIIAFLLFAHSIFSFSHFYVELDRLQYFFVSQVLFLLIISVVFSLLPLATNAMFHMKQKRVHNMIIYLTPAILIVWLILWGISTLPLLIIILVTLFFTIRILVLAAKKGERGIWFVAAGFLGLLFLGLFLVLDDVFSFNIRWEIISILVTLTYISVPLGMTLFMAHRFFVLYTGLETKVQERTLDLKKSFDDLRAAQNQLIHSEKMASLGELTAGIAHEIQNPLNFVNNFSEVGKELIDEIEEERAKDVESRDEELVGQTLSDLKQNLEKIHEHGQRADAIVKGMLQHSRTNSGQKEPTDINALADEYLRLSYHGLRAKDKSFNATFKTDFDPNLPKIEIIPQDIGRVLLNLINNAFYAAASVETSHALSLQEHIPTVTVTTKDLGDRVEISVKDNGPGIPEEIKNKIFQPFFTTKPAGQGTGLGLSLSYDIVKAHEGELSVETKPGEGSVFLIVFPK